MLSFITDGNFYEPRLRAVSLFLGWICQRRGDLLLQPAQNIFSRSSSLDHIRGIIEDTDRLIGRGTFQHTRNGRRLQSLTRVNDSLERCRRFAGEIFVNVHDERRISERCDLHTLQSDHDSPAAASAK